MVSTKVSVLVATRQPLIAAGIASFVKAQEDMQLVRITHSGESAINLVRELQPRVIVADFELPGLSGISLIQRCKEACPSAAILMLASSVNQPPLASALRAGMAGYLPKDVSGADVITAIRAVCAGEAVIDLRAVQAFLEELGAVQANASQNGVPALVGEREREVLRLAARGLSNRRIAQELYISERTVQSHLYAIFKRLRVSSRTEAVLLALKNGWIGMQDLS